MENLSITKRQKVLSTGRFYLYFKYTSKGEWKEDNIETTEQEFNKLKENPTEHFALNFLTNHINFKNKSKKWK